MEPSASDRAAFQRVFDAHYEAVSRYCLRRLPLQDARDATARTFVVAWRKIDAMPHDDGALPWLYRTARYEVETMRRTIRRQGALRSRLGGLGLPNGERPEAIVIQRAEDREVAEALEALAPGDREIILLRSHEELSIAEIAATLGCSANAAKQRLSRALKRLRRQLGIPVEVRATTENSRAIEEGGDR